MLAFVIGTVLGLWLLLSILNQFPLPFMRAIATYDRWFLLPVWTFFAPNPGSTDYRLVYRDFDRDETPSPWIEIPLVRRRAPLDAVWHPDKRRSKGIFDLGQHLLVLRHTYGDSAAIAATFPYVALLHYVDRLPRDGDVRYRQFMLVQTHGQYAGADPDILLRSEIHSVGA
jgi:hypothetical protein